MKSMNNSRQPKNDSALAVSVTIDEAPLLKNLVEKLAHRRKDLGYSHEAVPEGWKAIESSTIEAYVSGCMDIQEHDGYLAMSYTTCFSFSCTKALG